MSNKVVTRNIGPIQELVPSKDVIELHTRQEIERLLLELRLISKWYEDHYDIFSIEMGDNGPEFEYEFTCITLTELHAKLIELKKAQSE